MFGDNGEKEYDILVRFTQPLRMLAPNEKCFSAALGRYRNRHEAPSTRPVVCTCVCDSGAAAGRSGDYACLAMLGRTVI